MRDNNHDNKQNKATLTIRQAADLAGVHPNTIRNHIRAGKLKAEKVLVDNRETWFVSEEALYNCGIPEILRRLSPLEVTTRQDNLYTQQFATPDMWLEEITRLVRVNEDLIREVADKTTENEIIRYKAEKLLPATTEERDHLKAQVDEVRGERDEVREERDELRVKAEVFAEKSQLLEQALEEARANARWTWRRRMKKAVGE